MTFIHGKRLQNTKYSDIFPLCVSSSVVVCLWQGSLNICICTCLIVSLSSESIWASSPDRAEQRIRGLHWRRNEGLWHCIRDFSSMCTYHVPEEEAANYPYISYWEKVLSLFCFSEPHMHGVKWWQVLLQVFQVQYVHFQPFAGQHYTGNVQGDWQHLNANAKCHKCQIDLMLWLIEWAWLWTVWVWLHK